MCASSRVPLSSLGLDCWRLNDSNALLQSIGSPYQRIYSLILYSPHGTTWPSASLPVPSSLQFDLPTSLAYLPPQIDSPPSSLSSLTLAISTYSTHLQFLCLLDCRDSMALLNIILSTYTPTLVNSWRQLLSNCISCLTNPRSRKWRFSFFCFIGARWVLFFVPSFHLTTFSINLIRHLHLFLSYCFVRCIQSQG